MKVPERASGRDEFAVLSDTKHVLLLAAAAAG